eukprot:TRINITY_DN22273_c0_g4_i1.p1 TRINITY_DN22273_c0_g4~~TRINITY_DN22273_c0_g4_i1.p1  ORF type:complete len:695 (+),score=140.09 TRINITY_DN22273_c0_g4_i1:89-2173(+)
MFERPPTLSYTPLRSPKMGGEFFSAVAPSWQESPAPNTWPRPRDSSRERSRSERPLGLVRELSAACAPADVWRPLVIDEDRRCYSFLWPRALDEATSKDFLERLLAVAPWEELQNTKGTAVTRSTCWFARGGCRCHYTYGRGTRMTNGGGSCGEEDPASPFSTLMGEIMRRVFGELLPGLGEDAWPNSANLNLYSDGRRAVGWHTDDESLFRGKERDCPIISLSLGASREFWLALRRGQDSMDPDTRSVVEVDLKDGDLMTMEGRMQRHCVHLITKVNPREPLREPRVNITFRWIREHRQHCPLKHKPQAVPPVLRRLFGEVGRDRVGKRQPETHAAQPYMRCWARELMGGVLANPNCMEWRLCDNCKHKCFEEGRACCEGRGDWAGHWFCRVCWAKWEPDSVPAELPLEPSADSPAAAEVAAAYLQQTAYAAQARQLAALATQRSLFHAYNQQVLANGFFGQPGQGAYAAGAGGVYGASNGVSNCGANGYYGHSTFVDGAAWGPGSPAACTENGWPTSLSASAAPFACASPAPATAASDTGAAGANAAGDDEEEKELARARLAVAKALGIQLAPATSSAADRPAPSPQPSPAPAPAPAPALVLELAPALADPQVPADIAASAPRNASPAAGRADRAEEAARADGRGRAVGAANSAAAAPTSAPAPVKPRRAPPLALRLCPVLGSCLPLAARPA